MRTLVIAASCSMLNLYLFDPDTDEVVIHEEYLPHSVWEAGNNARNFVQTYHKPARVVVIWDSSLEPKSWALYAAGRAFCPLTPVAPTFEFVKDIPTRLSKLLARKAKRAKK